MERLTQWATIFCIFAISSAVFLSLALPLEDPITGMRETQNFPLWYNLYNGMFLVIFALLISSKIGEIIILLYEEKIILIVLLYILASCIWAIDTSGSFTEFYKTTIAILFGFFLAVRFTEKEILSLLSIAFAIMVVSSFFLALFYPEYGIHTGDKGQWRGAWGHKNQLSMRMLFAFIIFSIASVEFKKLKFRYYLFALLSALLIVLSQSGTGITILILILFFPIFIPLLRLHTAFLVASALAILSFGSLIYIIADKPDITSWYFISLDKDPTLSGRTETWNGILYSLSDYRSSHTLLGYGAQPWLFNNGQITVIPSITALSVDNMYMNILVKYGIVGSIIFGLLLFKATHVSLSQLKTKGKLLGNFYIVVMMVMLINGISENVDTTRIIWTFVVLILTSNITNHHNSKVPIQAKMATN